MTKQFFYSIFYQKFYSLFGERNIFAVNCDIFLWWSGIGCGNFFGVFSIRCEVVGNWVSFCGALGQGAEVPSISKSSNSSRSSKTSKAPQLDHHSKPLHQKLNLKTYEYDI